MDNLRPGDNNGCVFPGCLLAIEEGSGSRNDKIAAEGGPRQWPISLFLSGQLHPPEISAGAVRHRSIFYQMLQYDILFLV